MVFVKMFYHTRASVIFIRFFPFPAGKTAVKSEFHVLVLVIFVLDTA